MGRGCGTGDWTATSAATGSSANDDGDADGIDLRAMADSAIRIGELFGPAVKLSQKRAAWAVLATAVIATPYELVPSLLVFAAAAVLLLGNIEWYWSRTERPPEGLTFGSPLPSDRERADREADSEAESLRQVGVESAGTSAPNDPACQPLSASPAACGVSPTRVLAPAHRTTLHANPSLFLLPCVVNLRQVGECWHQRTERPCLPTPLCFSCRVWCGNARGRGQSPGHGQAFVANHTWACCGGHMHSVQS
jgi:hypothetical protein